ncbi:MAG TPA: iron ABC transporter permease [Anaerolineales bacterium]|jgi:thiamine transport system permease protein|nr:iron ABC transporter permease [Anaerolineales bacterium]
MEIGKQVSKRTSLSTFGPVSLSTPSRILLWLLPLSFFIVAFFYPLSRILILTLDADALTTGHILLASRVLLFTFYQATLSTLLTLLLGLPAAYLFARYDFRGKSLLRALTALPFMLPTVVVAAGFSALLGPRGLFTTFFPLPSFQFIGTLTAIIIAHVFYNTTIIIRLVGNALSSLDPRLEAAARSLGANPYRVLWHVTFPLLRPALLASLVLVFLFDFTSFGVVLLLGGSQFATLEVEIYLRVLRLPDLPLAALLSVIQLVCTILFSILYSRFATRSTIQTNPRSAQSNLRKTKTRREKIVVAAFIFLLTSFFILPLSALPIRSFFRLEADRGQRGGVQYGFTTDYYKELFINRRGSVFYVPPIRATGNSLAYAGGTVLLSLLLGFPAAFTLAQPTRLERILDPFIMLPLGSSAVMLGLGFILSYGAWLTSPLLVPFAHTLVALPFVIRTLQPAIASIPQRLRQAASSLGASPLEVWKNIDLPILRRATLAAGTFAFTISLGEFGATLLIARPEYPTIPVAIERFLSQPGGLNYGQAMAMATILMLLTVASILLIERVRIPGAGEF